jgi:hypothetical protein
MFGQIIQGHTSDPTGVRQAMQRWVRDLSPGVGLAAITAGTTHDGEFIAVLQFDSEDAARANSDRRKQDRWWADICAVLDGEVTVRNGMRTEVFLAGDLRRAEFVQVVQGRVSNRDRAREHLHSLQETLKVHLPALLGTVTIELEASRFTRALYFSTENEARAGEVEMPPELRTRDQEARQLIVGPVKFLDLREPWLYAAPSHQADQGESAPRQLST